MITNMIHEVSCYLQANPWPFTPLDFHTKLNIFVDIQTPCPEENCATTFLALTLPNVGRFLKFFHWWTQR